MSANISVGTTFGIVDGAPSVYSGTGTGGFPSLTYVTVGEVTEVPQFGGSATVTEHIPLASGVIDKLIGSINYGTITVPMASVWDDVGQIKEKAGFDGASARLVHSVKISNALVGTVYFTAKISAVQYTPGDANSVYNNSVTLELTNKIIEVDPV